MDIDRNDCICDGVTDNACNCKECQRAFREWLETDDEAEEREWQNELREFRRRARETKTEAFRRA